MIFLQAALEQGAFRAGVMLRFVTVKRHRLLNCFDLAPKFYSEPSDFSGCNASFPTPNLFPKHSRGHGVAPTQSWLLCGLPSLSSSRRRPLPAWKASVNFTNQYRHEDFPSTESFHPSRMGFGKIRRLARWNVSVLVVSVCGYYQTTFEL